MQQSPAQLLISSSSPQDVRAEVDRLFRRLKGLRRIFSRFEKVDVMYMAFIYFALIVEALS